MSYSQLSIHPKPNSCSLVFTNKLLKSLTHYFSFHLHRLLLQLPLLRIFGNNLSFSNNFISAPSEACHYHILRATVTFCVNVCYQVCKILKKNTYMKSTISSQLTQVPFFCSLILTFIFKVKLLSFYYFCKYLTNGEK